MAVVTVSNPGQWRTEGTVRLLVGQGRWAQERHHGAALTSSKEVQDDSNNLLIRQLDIGILVQAPVPTVLDQAVCDVPDVALGKEGPQVSKILIPDLPLHPGLVPHHPWHLCPRGDPPPPKLPSQLLSACPRLCPASEYWQPQLKGHRVWYHYHVDVLFTLLSLRRPGEELLSSSCSPQLA